MGKKNLKEEILAFVDWDLRSEIDGPDWFLAIKAIKPDIVGVMVTGARTEQNDQNEAMFNYGFMAHIDKAKFKKELISKILKSERLKKEFELLKKYHFDDDREESGTSQTRLTKGKKRKKQTRVNDYKAPEIVGESEVMQKLREKLDKICKDDSDTSVLILGETGTGKENVARYIHNNSPSRKNNPFEVVAGAGTETSLEHSFICGIEDEVATGTKPQAGVFELANGGTVFLDDVDNLSPMVQKILLRILQEKQVNRLTNGENINLNVKVIASTNQDLSKKVADKSFRHDLFYRLNVVVVGIPNLNDRRDDIPLLANHLLKKQLELSSNTIIKGFAPGVEEHLTQKPWPGNVRQLENYILGAIPICEGELLSIEHLEESKNAWDVFKDKEDLSPPNTSLCLNDPVMESDPGLALIEFIEKGLGKGMKYRDLHARINPGSKAKDEHSASVSFHNSMATNKITDRILSIDLSLAREKWPSLRSYYNKKDGAKWKDVKEKLKAFWSNNTLGASLTSNG